MSARMSAACGVVDLLGGDVVGVPRTHPRGGHPGVGADLAGEPGQAEVEDLDLAAGSSASGSAA